MFDAAGEHCPAMIAHFGGLLQNYEYRAEAYNPRPEDPQQFFEFAEEMIDSLDRGGYSETRLELLRFFTRTWIQPEWLEVMFQHWIETRHHGGNQKRASLGEKVMNDWPLRYVCWAERLFWA